MIPITDIRLLAAAVFLSSAGDLLALLTLALLIHEMTGSGIAVAALFGATMLPMIVLAPLAGAVSDRVESVRLLRTCSLASVPVAVGLALTGSLPALLALTAFLSAISALSQPAEFALIPKVSDQIGLVRANGLIETARYAGFTVGPLIAGSIAAVSSTKVALLANAASFLAIFGATCLIRARRLPEGGRVQGSDAPGPASGLAGLFRDRALRLTVIASTASLLFLSGVMTVEVFFIKDVLGSTDAAYAGVTAAWMAGMVIGATRLAPRFRAGAAATAALVGLCVQGAGMGSPAMFASLPALVIGFLIGGIGHGLKNTMTRTLIHERVPEAEHGRVFASYNGLRNAAEIGALAGGGLMVTVIGPRPALLVAGFAPFAIALLGLAVLRSRPTRQKVTDLTVSPETFS